MKKIPSNPQNEKQVLYGAPEFLTRTGESLPRYQNWITGLFISQAKSLGAKRILDFGAGTGYLASCFRAQTKIQPLLLEIDPSLRARCISQGFETYSTLAEVPTELDFIYSSNVLEHIENDLEMLIKLKGKLRIGGKIALYLPAFNILWSNMDVRVGHYRRYNRKNLSRLLRGAGYNVELCHYADSLGFFVTLLYKSLPGRDGEASKESLHLYDNYIFPLSRKLDGVVRSFVGKNIFIVARKEG
ncbi:class I SAM-dependent methyltransferase [Comamonadaceae bacterium OH2545_COT-014]|nr:class I SAM-dependent methyltransferase [Comamonadaceae bacterium OH2545_COT-014]